MRDHSRRSTTRSRLSFKASTSSARTLAFRVSHNRPAWQPPAKDGDDAPAPREGKRK